MIEPTPKAGQVAVSQRGQEDFMVSRYLEKLFAACSLETPAGKNREVRETSTAEQRNIARELWAFLFPFKRW